MHLSQYLCAGPLGNSPGHGGRNLIRDPPSAAELCEMGFDCFEQSFPDGRPFEFTRFACELAS